MIERQAGTNTKQNKVGGGGGMFERQTQIQNTIREKQSQRWWID